MTDCVTGSSTIIHQVQRVRQVRKKALFQTGLDLGLISKKLGSERILYSNVFGTLNKITKVVSGGTSSSHRGKQGQRRLSF